MSDNCCRVCDQRGNTPTIAFDVQSSILDANIVWIMYQCPVAKTILFQICYSQRNDGQGGTDTKCLYACV